MDATPQRRQQRALVTYASVPYLLSAAAQMAVPKGRLAVGRVLGATEQSAGDLRVELRQNVAELLGAAR